MKKLFVAVLLAFFFLQFSFADLKGKVIVIDPGHGGPEDRGAVGEFLEEAVINLKTALYLREMLEECGATVIMTRTADIDVSLAERANLANRVNADLFVSLHFNSMKNAPSSDFSIAYYSALSADYARNLAQFLIETFKEYVGTSGDAGPGDVYLMREVKVPAVLGEPCHISNAEREKWLSEDENLKLVARAYREAICRLFNSEIPRLELEKVDDVIRTWTFRIECSSDVDKAFAFFGNRPLNVEVQDGYLVVDVPENLAPGKYVLTAYAIGKNGIYSKKYTKTVSFEPPVDRVEVKVLPQCAPAVAGSYYRIDFTSYAKQHRVEREPVFVSLDHGFFAKEKSRVIVPYMGKDEVLLTLTFEATSITIPLIFSGDRYVEILEVYGSDGVALGTIENFGEPVKISFSGYEEITYEAPVTRPVSFKVLRVNKTFEGFLKGKKILLAAPQESEGLKKVAEVLRNYGAEAEVLVIQSKRDELNLAKKATSADFVFLKALNLRVKATQETFVLTSDDELSEVLGLLKKAGGFE